MLLRKNRVSTMLLCSFVILFLFGCSGNASATDAQWNLSKLHMSEAWRTSEGHGETIAFIDTGISNDLLKKYQNRIVAPYNVLNGTSNVNDLNGHGTEMVSAACGDGFDSVWGIAPRANIMPIVAVDSQGNTSGKILAKAIQWAVEHNANVINLSLGSVNSNSDVLNALKEASKKHIFAIAAAGDYGDPALLFPANVPGVVSVEAEGQNGQLYQTSNHGPSASIMAPGEAVPVLTVDDNFHLKIAKADGTSVSTAIVSGLSAIALSVNPDLTSNEMVKLLRGSKDDGFVDANKLIVDEKGLKRT